MGKRDSMLQLFKKRLSNRKGFTLVELLVVISIIGILAAIAVPRFTDATNSAKIAKIQADLRTIDSAMAIYNAKKGSYPSATQIVTSPDGTLTSFPTPPTGAVTASPSAAPNPLEYVIDATAGRATYGGKTADQVN